MTPAEVDVAVFAALRDAAVCGRGCPSSRAIGLSLSVSEYVIGRSLRRLEARGEIKIITSNFRRRVEIPGVGMTGMSHGGNHFSGQGWDQPVERLPPERSPWVGHCFSAHDSDPGDDIGSFSAPETVVPRAGVLA